MSLTWTRPLGALAVAAAGLHLFAGRPAANATEAKDMPITNEAKEGASDRFVAARDGDYLNPRALERCSLLAPFSALDAAPFHKVRCYFNGRWWACPNPYDERRVKSLERQLADGRFILSHDYRVPDHCFNRRSSWNSAAHN